MNNDKFEEIARRVLEIPNLDDLDDTHTLSVSHIRDALAVAYIRGQADEKRAQKAADAEDGLTRMQFNDRDLDYFERTCDFAADAWDSDDDEDEMAKKWAANMLGTIRLHIKTRKA